MRVADGYKSKIKFSVTLFPDTCQKLKQACANRGMHKSQFIEHAVLAALGPVQDPNPPMTSVQPGPQLFMIVPYSEFQRGVECPAAALAPLVDPDAQPEEPEAPVQVTSTRSEEMAHLRKRVEQAVQTYVAELVGVLCGELERRGR